MTSRLLAAFLDDRVSVSIGVATHPDQAHTADQPIRAADLALLDAKRRGKQRFSIAA